MNTDDINRLVEQLVKEKVNTTLTDSLIEVLDQQLRTKA